MKVVLETDNRTILCLSMLLSQEYQYLVQIWTTTPAITAKKARTMVLEASRQQFVSEFSERGSEIQNLVRRKCGLETQ